MAHAQTAYLVVFAHAARQLIAPSRVGHSAGALQITDVCVHAHHCRQIRSGGGGGGVHGLCRRQIYELGAVDWVRGLRGWKVRDHDGR